MNPCSFSLVYQQLSGTLFWNSLVFVVKYQPIYNRIHYSVTGQVINFTKITMNCSRDLDLSFTNLINNNLMEPHYPQKVDVNQRKNELIS